MKGEEFESLMRELGYNQVTLAERLATNRQAISRQCKADYAEEVFACALRWLVAEKTANQMAKLVSN